MYYLNSISHTFCNGLMHSILNKCVYSPHFHIHRKLPKKYKQLIIHRNIAYLHTCREYLVHLLIALRIHFSYNEIGIRRKSIVLDVQCQI